MVHAQLESGPDPHPYPDFDNRTDPRFQKADSLMILEYNGEPKKVSATYDQTHLRKKPS